VWAGGADVEVDVEGEDFSGTTREDMLPERSTTFWEIKFRDDSDHESWVIYFSAAWKDTYTALMLLDMLTCTEIFMLLAVTALLASPSLSPLGRAPYLGAMLVGIVNSRPVPKTSMMCCSSKLAGSFVKSR